jgi:hypothetical protein
MTTWQRWYAWLPVIAEGRYMPFTWLEYVWRRRSESGRWEYHHFLTEAERREDFDGHQW